MPWFTFQFLFIFYSMRSSSQSHLGGSRSDQFDHVANHRILHVCCQYFRKKYLQLLQKKWLQPSSRLKILSRNVKWYGKSSLSAKLAYIKVLEVKNQIKCCVAVSVTVGCMQNFHLLRTHARTHANANTYSLIILFLNLSALILHTIVIICESNRCGASSTFSE